MDAFGNAIGNSIVQGIQSKPKTYKEGDTYTNQDGTTSIVGGVDENGQPTTLVNAYPDLKEERELYAKWRREGDAQAAALAQRKFEYREAELEAHFTELYTQREAAEQAFLASLNDPYRDAIKPVSIFPVEWGIDEAISVGQEAYNFLEKPSWQSAALLGTSLIPGRFIDDSAGKLTTKLFGDNTSNMTNNINPDLADRLEAYKAWKIENDFKPSTVEEFKLFDDPFRVESNFQSYAWTKEWPPMD